MRMVWKKGFDSLFFLVVVLLLIGALCWFASRPRQTAAPEEIPEVQEEAKETPPEDVALKTGTVAGNAGGLHFAFSLDNLIASYNSAYWKTYGEAVFLPPAEEWSITEAPGEGDRPAQRVYSVSPGGSGWFWPTLSVYIPEGGETAARISLDLDEHSDTQVKHEFYREMCLEVFGLLLPDLSQEKREALYERLDRQAYQDRYDTRYLEVEIPRVVYYQGEIGVFPFFALGDYERITLLPVDQTILETWKARGTQVIDLEQWQP